MKRVIPAMMLMAVLMGCGAVDTMTEGFEHSQNVATDLEKSVGLKPFVGFRWHNGSLANVSVTFEGIPDSKSTTEIAALSRTAIASHFKQSPEQVIISFAVPGSEQ